MTRATAWVRLLRRDQGGGHERGDAEIGPVRQAGEEAQEHEGFEGRRHGADHIADREDRHQQEEKRLARELRRQHGDDRSADHDAERIGADGVSGLGRRDVEFLGEVRQQAHDRELAGADAEAADCKRQLDQGDSRSRLHDGGNSVLRGQTDFLGNGHVGHEGPRLLMKYRKRNEALYCTAKRFGGPAGMQPCPA